MKAEFNTDSLLTKLALRCVRVSVFYELSSSVTLVVTIQMQSIVPSREWSPGTSASHLRPSFLLSELQRGATLHKYFTFTHKPTDCGHKSTQERECAHRRATSSLPRSSFIQYPELSRSSAQRTPLLHTHRLRSGALGKTHSLQVMRLKD